MDAEPDARDILQGRLSHKADAEAFFHKFPLIKLLTGTELSV
jgi:hypothetical protein